MTSLVKPAAMLRTLLLFTLLVAAGCKAPNTVTTEELAAIKPGSILIWRYQKADKSWFYADKIESVQPETITYVTSKKEGTSKRMEELLDFDSRKFKTTPSELAKFATEQGPERKVVIEIR